MEGHEHPELAPSSGRCTSSEVTPTATPRRSSRRCAGSSTPSARPSRP